VAVDQAPALNEAALLQLRRTHAATNICWMSENEELVGYAQLASGPEWSAGQLVVAPEPSAAGHRHSAAAAS
jgi:hypothetical protein